MRDTKFHLTRAGRKIILGGKYFYNVLHMSKVIKHKYQFHRAEKTEGHAGHIWKNMELEVSYKKTNIVEIKDRRKDRKDRRKTEKYHLLVPYPCRNPITENWIHLVNYKN